MEVIVLILEKLGMALLGTFFSTLAASAKNAGIDAAALDYLAQSVASAEVNPNLASPAAKFHFVESDFYQYVSTRKLSLADSVIHALIELAVHNLHQSKPAS